MRTSKNELRYDLREIAVEIFKEVSERETITNRLSINFVDNDKMFETIVDDTKVETKYKKINFYTNKTDVYGAITSVYFYETEKGYSIITKTRENKICNLKYTGKHKEKRKEGFLYFSYEKLSTSNLDELVMINAVIEKYHENKEWFTEHAAAEFLRIDG